MFASGVRVDEAHVVDPLSQQTAGPLATTHSEGTHMQLALMFTAGLLVGSGVTAIALTLGVNRLVRTVLP